MAVNGIYVTPNQFVRFKRDLSKEIVTRARSADFYGFGNMPLPNPDKILRDLGVRNTVYKDLRSDAHVGGCIRRRKASVKALEWGIGKNSEHNQITQMLQDIFENLDVSRIIAEMMDAVFFGYKPLEVIWGKVGQYIVPLDIIGKPPEWFVYSEDNELRFLSKEFPIAGEPLPKRKFLVARQDPTYDNPYGFADLSMVFWPTSFKRGGLKFWLQFTEKYGTPWLIGKHPRSANDREANQLLDSLELMVQDAVAVVPDDSSVEIVEAAGKSSSSEVFNSLLRFCRSEVSIALLGQNQTTEENSNRASAEVGIGVTEDIRDGDTDIICEAFNQLIRWMVELNFNTDDYPKFTMWEKEQVDTVQAERDLKLSQTGVRFTKQYYTRVYDLEDGDLDDTPREVSNPYVAFAEEDEHGTIDQVELDNALNELVNGVQTPASQLLAPVFEKIKAGESADVLLGELADLYYTMGYEDLQERLARMMFVAKVWGRLNGND
ncbi:DUF935 domain-containing protein [Oligella urethralis]|uniref:DUF935 domain-containing protein n=1 Tax=Oligella urethralis TaxID=90245 RepID=UPI000DF8B942|nr:DUF935 family protein [Oligella urethralis]SUA58080.1 Mu-like prophage protein gp29 [Oligella urethralis]